MQVSVIIPCFNEKNTITKIIEKSIIQGFLFCVWSATAPKIGEKTATTIPETVTAIPIKAWPSTGLSATACTKYGPNIKVAIKVCTGWQAQSKSIQE